MQISINANRCEPSPMRKFHPLAVAAEQRGKKIYHLNIGQPDIATPSAYFEAVPEIRSPNAGLRCLSRKSGAHPGCAELLCRIGR